MKLCWPVVYEESSNFWGLADHANKTKAALERQGVEFSPDAPIAVWVGNPADAAMGPFPYYPDKRNVFYMAWECYSLPEKFRSGVERADAVAVSSEFLKIVVQRHFPDKPIAVVPEGIDPSVYKYRMRKVPGAGERFEFLWVGSLNTRKGTNLLPLIWRMFCRVVARLQGRGMLLPKPTLRVKLTRHEKEGEEKQVAEGLIMDSRRLPLEELVKLYERAHCFVYPTFGEGFALTVAQACATGLPSVHTHCTALMDLYDESCAYPVPFDWTKQLHLGVPTRLCQPKLDAFVARMMEVMVDYGRARIKGRRASDRMRAYTWDRAGETLKAALEKWSREWGI